MRRSSIKRSKSSAATLVSKSGELARPQLVLDETGSGAASPGTSGGHASRPCKCLDFIVFHCRLVPSMETFHNCH